jgi:hypothetical protein
MRTILLIFITIIPMYLFSQISGDGNLDRYWFYRERLKYFVKVGTLEGESCISSYRNITTGPNGDLSQQLHFGDQTVFLGWYIGVLATEYRLLMQNGQNTDKTLKN